MERKALDSCLNMATQGNGPYSVTGGFLRTPGLQRGSASVCLPEVCLAEIRTVKCCRFLASVKSSVVFFVWVLFGFVCNPCAL